MTSRSIVAATVLCAMAAGCATPPAMPPQLAIDQSRCTPRVDGGTASNLLLTPETSRSITVDIDANAPCLVTADGHAGLYHAFILPLSGEHLIVTASSLPAGKALLGPRILLLDADGHTTREVGPQAFLFRDDALTAIVRLRPEDRMLVVVSTPETIGQTVDRLQEQVQQTPIAVYPVFAQVYTGSETRSQAVLSYTGRIKVMLRKLPDDQVGP